MTDLIPIGKVSGTDLFVGDKLDELLEAIKIAAHLDEIDLSSITGRKEIASRAYAVSRAKSTIDDAGKELVSEWKQKSKAVDAERKRSRDYLDALRDEVRQPLTEWEAERERIVQEKVDAENRRIEAEAEAKRLDMERREAEILAREQAIAKAEQEAMHKANEERAEKERVEREAERQREIAAATEQERLAAIAREKQAKIQAAKDTKEAAEKAEHEKQEAVLAAEKRMRLEAKTKARVEADKKAAIEAQERKLSEDKGHRRSVNKSAVSLFVDEGFSSEGATKIVTLIASNMIPCLSIDYSQTGGTK